MLASLCGTVIHVRDGQTVNPTDMVLAEGLRAWDSHALPACLRVAILDAATVCMGVGCGSNAYV